VAGADPVPDSGMERGLAGPLCVRFKAAERAPSPEGVNVMFTFADWPGARFSGNAGALKAKSEV
jgi:hypothetical protein